MCDGTNSRQFADVGSCVTMLQSQDRTGRSWLSTVQYRTWVRNQLSRAMSSSSTSRDAPFCTREATLRSASSRKTVTTLAATLCRMASNRLCNSPAVRQRGIRESLVRILQRSSQWGTAGCLWWHPHPPDVLQPAPDLDNLAGHPPLVPVLQQVLALPRQVRVCMMMKSHSRSRSASQGDVDEPACLLY